MLLGLPVWCWNDIGVCVAGNVLLIIKIVKKYIINNFKKWNSTEVQESKSV